MININNISKRVSWLVIFLFATIFQQAQNYDFNTLIERITLDNRTGIKDSGTLDLWVSGQNINGSWGVFGYGKLTTSNAMNTTDNHVLRLWHLAAAVSKKDH